MYDGLSQNDTGLQFDQRGFKDVVAQVVHLWGESHSVAALWYHGNAAYGAGPFSDATDRLSLMGNYRLKIGRTWWRASTSAATARMSPMWRIASRAAGGSPR